MEEEEEGEEEEFPAAPTIERFSPKRLSVKANANISSFLFLVGDSAHLRAHARLFRRCSPDDTLTAYRKLFGTRTDEGISFHDFSLVSDVSIGTK